MVFLQQLLEGCQITVKCLILQFSQPMLQVCQFQAIVGKDFVFEFARHGIKQWSELWIGNVLAEIHHVLREIFHGLLAFGLNKARVNVIARRLLLLLLHLKACPCLQL